MPSGPVMGLGVIPSTVQPCALTHSAAASQFQHWLKELTPGKAAREYLASRGFNQEIITHFQVGVAPDSWDALLRSPLMKKFTPNLLAVGGLVKAREGSRPVYPYCACVLLLLPRPPRTPS